MSLTLVFWLGCVCVCVGLRDFETKSAGSLFLERSEEMLTCMCVCVLQLNGISSRMSMSFRSSFPFVSSDMPAPVTPLC